MVSFYNFVKSGAIDPGENPEQAARRELEEELGNPGNLKMTPAFVFKTKAKTQQGNPVFTYHNFIGVIDQEDPSMEKQSGQWETSEFKWFSLQDATKLANKHPGLKMLLKDLPTQKLFRTA